jgi:HAD superfamily hydrolase (TIGR01549 family)
MTKLRVALFDADGVLLDSLTPHLKICEDKSKEYGLGLNIPTPSEFKQMARGGVQVSPMKEFFLAVGFPLDFAEKANQQYQRIFMQAYAPRPFSRLRETLSALQSRGMKLGIVTSNIEKNVAGALGDSIEFFPEGSIFSKDNMDGKPKSEAITAALCRFQAAPSEAIYVGDQLADWEAAKAAGVAFLGAAYGWGISEEDKEFPIVREISEIYAFIAACA